MLFQELADIEEATETFLSMASSISRKSSHMSRSISLEKANEWRDGAKPAGGRATKLGHFIHEVQPDEPKLQPDVALVQPNKPKLQPDQPELQPRLAQLLAHLAFLQPDVPELLARQPDCHTQLHPELLANNAFLMTDLRHKPQETK